MERFVIEITNDEYYEIVRYAKEADLCDIIQKEISMTYEICKSFILPIKILYTTIVKLADYTDYEIDLYEIENKIRKVVHLSNEEWNKYFIEGLKNIDFLYSDDGELMTDTEGNPYKFLWEECAIILNSECECNSVMRGQSDS